MEEASAIGVISMLSKKEEACVKVGFENALGIKVTLSQPTTKARSLPGCVRNCVAGTSEVIIFSTDLVRHLGCCIQNWASLVQERLRFNEPRPPKVVMIGGGASVVQGEAESWNCSTWRTLRRDLTNAQMHDGRGHKPSQALPGAA